MSRPPMATAQVGLFSYKAGDAPPALARFSFDCSNFRDPQGQGHLRNYDGRSPRVRDWIVGDDRVGVVKSECLILVEMHLRSDAEKFLGIGFFDRHGKWIAPAVAEEVAVALEDLGYAVAVRHQELPTGGTNG